MHFPLSTVKQIINDHKNLEFNYPFQDIYLLRLLQITTDALINNFSNNFAHYQLNDIRLILLLAIQGKSQQGVSPSDLSNLFNISRVKITRELDILEKNSWVERRVHPTDRRAQQLFLTSAGQQFLNQTAGVLQSHLVEMLSDVTSDEKTILLNVLNKLYNHATNNGKE